ncbi:MAG TPA: glycosyltransferase family A protein [Actinomycetaceae bacterium]|nr:glycosyltransferase family A protein [Actinomycetaceae bacterium]
MTRASIVIPAYDAASYLPRCIDSLLAQTERSLQVIVVDDGSTDETPALADRYAALDARIQVIHQPNRGLSAARNAGIAAARGDFLCLLDADDWAEPTMIETMISWCEKADAQVAIAGAHADIHDSNDELIRSRLRTLPHYVIRRGIPPSVDLAEESTVLLLGYAWNKMYRRDWLSRLGARFEEGLEMVEDIDFNARVLAAADRIVLLPDAFVHYVQRPRETLSTKRGPDFLGLRLRAAASVDSLLESFGVDSSVRSERKAHASAIALWMALQAAAASRAPRRNLRRMLEQPGADTLMAHASAAPRPDWRGRWAVAALGRGWHGVALVPAYGIQVLRRVAPKWTGSAAAPGTRPHARRRR